MRELTPEQRAAVTLSNRPLVLVAAAGSGKTTVLVDRYLATLRAGARPGQILTVTFTNEAAAQLRERILVRLEKEKAEPTVVEGVASTGLIGTIHGFCYGILNEFGSLLGLKSIEGIVSPFDQVTVFESSYRDWLDRLPSPRLEWLLQYFSSRELRSLVKEACSKRYRFQETLNHLSNETEDATILKAFHEDIAPLLATLESSFQGKGLYTFDDLEHLALRILETSGEAKDRIRKRLRYVLVDEFQDTSRLQWRILEEVIGEEWQKLFVVGDPKQSIYGFRQADVRLFKRVADSIQVLGGELRELSINFRTTPELLSPINQVGHGLFASSPFGFSPMQSGKEEGHGVDFSVIRFTTLETRSASVGVEVAASVEEGQTPPLARSDPRRHRAPFPRDRSDGNLPQRTRRRWNPRDVPAHLPAV